MQDKREVKICEDAIQRKRIQLKSKQKTPKPHCGRKVRGVETAACSNSSF